MKLTKLELTNFRCFESFSLPLDPHLNVIVGANGAGKSTLLDAIAAALYEIVAANKRGGSRQRAAQSASLRPTDLRLIHRGDGSDTPASFVRFRATATDFYPLDRFPDKTPTGDPVALEWTQHISYEPLDGFQYQGRTTTRLAPIYDYFRALWRELGRSSPQALIPLPMVAYYRASRRFDGQPELGRVLELALAREDAFTHALDAGNADYAAMAQWFYLRENAELRTGAAGEGSFNDLRAMRQVLTHMVDGLRRVFFDGMPPRLKVELAPAPGEGARILELAQLSDGYRNLIALVLDFARRLAQANPRWPNPLDAPGILLVDELELHLHPSWQQTVIPRLRAAFPNTQLIVATHSPAVISTIRRENLLLLGSDHRLEALPADVGTYGADNSRVLAEVFGTHPRPPNVETVRQLDDYLALIEERKERSERALALRAQLDKALGSSEPMLRRADARIHQLEFLAKR
ncbi:MAG: AAA family ATPase [Myxococcota bacterium]|jgi:predicted ATPase|nr:AAA family ATPase [Myxococcota bacterium]